MAQRKNCNLTVIVKLALTATVCLVASIAHAEGIYCDEDIDKVIVHNNGNVYFKTLHSCSASWCEIDFATPEAVDRAYSLLLAAKTTGSQVKLFWTDIQFCSDTNAVYASPGSVQLI